MEAIKKVSTYVSQLRRVGKGHGKFTILIVFKNLLNDIIFGEPFIVLNMSELARPLMHSKKLFLYCQVCTTLIWNYKRVRLLK